ncbi:MAG: GNAT family N-acetyltransferase [Rivularia sp. ALOHA_DT_140]|nr:GNAT family N-acetyltransferase [Rivularia sp. ALOHA_DT_140]
MHQQINIVIRETTPKEDSIIAEHFYKTHRRKGIAKQLTKATIEHLKSINCTSAILNASPAGKPVYNNLGFSPSNAMKLDLI